MVVAEALHQRNKVYNVAFSIDPQCPMRGAAMQLIRNVLQECGRLLAIVPDQSTLSQDLDVVEASIASDHAQDWIERKCRIPAVVAEILVEPVSAATAEQTDDVLDIIQHVTAPAGDEIRSRHRRGRSSCNCSAQQARRAGSNRGAGAREPAASQAGKLVQPTGDPVARGCGAVDSVLNLVGELIVAKSMMHQAIGEFDRRFPKDPLKMKFLTPWLPGAHHERSAKVRDEDPHGPGGASLPPLPARCARCSQIMRQEINLVITGQDTDLDKSILDMLAEPLAHVVRNAVDHGIESPSERIQCRQDCPWHRQAGCLSPGQPDHY